MWGEGRGMAKEKRTPFVPGLAEYDREDLLEQHRQDIQHSVGNIVVAQ